MDSTTENKIDEPITTTENGGEKRRIFPSFIDIAAIFGAFIVTQIVAALLSQLLLPRLLTGLSEPELQGWIMLTVQLISMTLTIIFIHVMRRKRQAEPIKISLSLKGFDPIILLGGLLMLLSATVVIEPLLELLPPLPSIGGRGWPMLVAVVIGAPLFEEYICRGLIFESMRSKSGTFVALMGSSLFFGLLHLHPSMVINAFVMGLILGYIYIRSQSLLSSITLHALNNAIAYLLIIIGLGENTTLRELITSDTIYYIIYALAAMILLISFFLSRARFKLIALERTKAEEQDQTADVEQSESQEME